ncbi:archaeal ATPase [bacterium BMS3Abin09]|nr:archaeal ATPase [bacterium BMS3Abin09]GBE41402.1 archaeal ATPase [bacterium BMS3Bbin09]
MILDRSVSKNFFGRENMLEVLYKTVANAKGGGTESVILSGKRGIGKTKLLENLYNLVFERQDVVPFFYTVRRSFVSSEDFANDYLGSFILQALAFMGKDPAVLSGVYSLEELKEAARVFGACWIADIIYEYIDVRKEGREAKIVLNAISAPYRSYQITGNPVVVMIDDLHKIRKFCEPKSNEINSGFWTLFEDSISSMHVPHIFSGVPHEIEKVFFEDNLLGDYLEMIDLPRLNTEDSVKLFRALCEMYGLKVEIEPADLIGTFGGNPLYIKNFLQAARHAGGTLSKAVFEQTYDSEITIGKTYRYWTFLLKKYVRPLELRKPSLSFLHGLSNDNNDDFPQLEQDMSERISEILHDSGSLETGFSETMPADNFLRDIVKELYRREIQHELPDKVTELIVANESSQVRESVTASFIITIPADPKAGLVAIKLFEQIAMNYKIPLKEMGKLQLAMADLFSNVLAGDASAENFKFQIKRIEDSFLVEITTPQKELVLIEQDISRIGAYIDDLKVESIESGTVITLVKEIKEDVVPPEGD